MRNVIRFFIFILILINYNVAFSQETNNHLFFHSSEEAAMYLYGDYFSNNIEGRLLKIQKYFLAPISYTFKLEELNCNHCIFNEFGYYFIQDVETYYDTTFLTNLIAYSHDGITVLDSVLFFLSLQKIRTKEKSKGNDIFIELKDTNKYNESFFGLDVYLKNNISNRILFIERYYEKLGTNAIKLIKIDLDALLYCKTKTIISNNKINEKILLNNLKRWKTKL